MSMDRGKTVVIYLWVAEVARQTPSTYSAVPFLLSVRFLATTLAQTVLSRSVEVRLSLIAAPSCGSATSAPEFSTSLAMPMSKARSVISAPGVDQPVRPRYPDSVQPGPSTTFYMSDSKAAKTINSRLTQEAPY